MPVVSVIIPARNEEAHLAGALASVLEQCCPLEQIEAIVVDNASSDGTAAAASAFARSHPDLQVVVTCEPKPGVARAKNRGARAAAGEILLFLDADSRMESTLIEDVVDAYRAGALAGSIRIVADSDDPFERGFFALMEVGKLLFGVRAQMMYCDRVLFLALGGFRPELRQAEDLEFLQRVREHVAACGQGEVSHIRSSRILTSTRRLQGGLFRSQMLVTFARWLLAFMGIGREWKY
jgi:glycosyltransferase involved in cell wall biosynthesis